MEIEKKTEVEEGIADDETLGESPIENADREQADTPAAGVGEPEPAPEKQPERTFTQEQVNALVGKARQEGREKGYEQARREAFERYGVEGDDELDEIFANGSRYGELSSRYADESNGLREARTELALVKSGVLPERQGDVKAILGANGMEITVENIESLLPTHPEWKGTPTALPDQTPAKATAPIPQPEPQGEGNDDLGPQPKPETQELGDEGREYEEAMRNFGLRK